MPTTSVPYVEIPAQHLANLKRDETCSEPRVLRLVSRRFRPCALIRNDAAVALLPIAQRMVGGTKDRPPQVEEL